MFHAGVDDSDHSYDSENKYNIINNENKRTDKNNNRNTDNSSDDSRKYQSQVPIRSSKVRFSQKIIHLSHDGILTAEDAKDNDQNESSSEHKHKQKHISHHTSHSHRRRSHKHRKKPLYIYPTHLSSPQETRNQMSSRQQHSYHSSSQQQQKHQKRENSRHKHSTNTHHVYTQSLLNMNHYYKKRAQIRNQQQRKPNERYSADQLSTMELLRKKVMEKNRDRPRHRTNDSLSFSHKPNNNKNDKYSNLRVNINTNAHRHSSASNPTPTYDSNPTIIKNRKRKRKLARPSLFMADERYTYTTDDSDSCSNIRTTAMNMDSSCSTSDLDDDSLWPKSMPITFQRSSLSNSKSLSQQSMKYINIDGDDSPVEDAGKWVMREIPPTEDSPESVRDYNQQRDKSIPVFSINSSILNSNESNISSNSIMIDSKKEITNNSNENSGSDGKHQSFPVSPAPHILNNNISQDMEISVLIPCISTPVSELEDISFINKPINKTQVKASSLSGISTEYSTTTSDDMMDILSPSTSSLDSQMKSTPIPIFPIHISNLLIPKTTEDIIHSCKSSVDSSSSISSASEALHDIQLRSQNITINAFTSTDENRRINIEHNLSSSSNSFHIYNTPVTTHLYEESIINYENVNSNVFTHNHSQPQINTQTHRMQNSAHSESVEEYKMDSLNSMNKFSNMLSIEVGNNDDCKYQSENDRSSEQKIADHLLLHSRESPTANKRTSFPITSSPPSLPMKAPLHSPMQSPSTQPISPLSLSSAALPIIHHSNEEEQDFNIDPIPIAKDIKYKPFPTTNVESAHSVIVDGDDCPSISRKKSTHVSLLYKNDIQSSTSERMGITLNLNHASSVALEEEKEECEEIKHISSVEKNHEMDIGKDFGGDTRAYELWILSCVGSNNTTTKYNSKMYHKLCEIFTKQTRCSRVPSQADFQMILLKNGAYKKNKPHSRIMNGYQSNRTSKNVNITQNDNEWIENEVFWVIIDYHKFYSKFWKWFLECCVIVRELQHLWEVNENQSFELSLFATRNECEHILRNHFMTEGLFCLRFSAGIRGGLVLSYVLRNSTTYNAHSLTRSLSRRSISINQYEQNHDNSRNSNNNNSNNHKYKRKSQMNLSAYAAASVSSSATDANANFSSVYAKELIKFRHAIIIRKGKNRYCLKKNSHKKSNIRALSHIIRNFSPITFLHTPHRIYHKSRVF